ncbi:GntR family transcriptional regulator [Nonomuraea sp. NPDC050547]|uniref:GntR family transcriptional regulator n=1 Tax=Nonomuraea sp. NPDC050547 TaxID=3364368 RepID=UPI00378AF845
MVEIKAPVSRWKQVAEYLRERILDGTFPAGQPLPSEQQLAEEFGLSRPTIRNAINELKAAGLVEVQRPKGTFVRSLSARPARVDHRGLTRTASGAYEDSDQAAWQEVDSPSHLRINAALPQTELLAIPPGEPMLVRLTLERAEGTSRMRRLSMPFSVAQDTPWTDDPALPAPSEVYGYFDQQGRLSWQEYVRARMPLPDEAETLKALAGTPVLHITRVATLDKRPIALDEVVVCGDALEAVYTITASKPRSR